MHIIWLRISFLIQWKENFLKSINEQASCIYPFSIVDYQNSIFFWRFLVKANVWIGFSADSDWNQDWNYVFWAWYLEYTLYKRTFKPCSRIYNLRLVLKFRGADANISFKLLILMIMSNHDSMNSFSVIIYRCMIVKTCRWKMSVCWTKGQDRKYYVFEVQAKVMRTKPVVNEKLSYQTLTYFSNFHELCLVQLNLT